MSGAESSFSFENPRYEQSLLSQELLTAMGKDLASLVKQWQTKYEQIEGQKLSETHVKDFVFDVIATIEDRCKGTYPDIRNRVTRFFNELWSKGIKFIKVADVRKDFTDEEIRCFMTYNLPKGWDHGGISSSQMNYKWMETNFDNLIRLQNGSLIQYFAYYDNLFK